MEGQFINFPTWNVAVASRDRSRGVQGVQTPLFKISNLSKWLDPPFSKKILLISPLTSQILLKFQDLPLASLCYAYG
jgi:hypothetical protein